MSFLLHSISQASHWGQPTLKGRGLILHYLIWTYMWSKEINGSPSLETIYRSSPTGHHNSHTSYVQNKINSFSSQGAPSLISLWYWIRIFIEISFKKAHLHGWESMWAYLCQCHYLKLIPLACKLLEHKNWFFFSPTTMPMALCST